MKWKLVLAVVASTAIGLSLMASFDEAEARKGFRGKPSGHIFRGARGKFQMRPGRHSFYRNQGFKGRQHHRYGKSWQKAGSGNWRKGKQTHAHHGKGKGGHYGNYRQRKHASYGHGKGKGHYAPHQSRPKRYMTQTATANAVASAAPVTNVFVGNGGGQVDVSGLLRQIWEYSQANPNTRDQATYVDHRAGVQVAFDSEDCGCPDYDAMWEHIHTRTECHKKGPTHRWVKRSENPGLAVDERCVAVYLK